MGVQYKARDLTLKTGVVWDIWKVKAKAVPIHATRAFGGEEV
jgi:hypothetical protein